MEQKTIEMDKLLGIHLLSGVETDYIKFKDPESYTDQDQVNVIRFILDDVSYMAVEDPEDGYRSCMGRIFIGFEVKNVFDPIEVICVKKEEKEGDRCDILQMVNPLISKVIVEFGTDHSDDYYPSFVSSFSPRYLTEATYAKSLLENEKEE